MSTEPEPSMPEGQQPGSPRARRARGSKSRWPEILQAAMDLFEAKGYEATTMQEIAERAGLANQGSLYYYIESKEGLLWELMERNLPSGLNRLEKEVLASGEDAPTRLATFVELWTRGLRDGMLRGGRDFLRHLSPERRARAIALRDKVSAVLGRIVEQGMREGDFDPTLQKQVVVNTILTTLNRTYEWYEDSGPMSIDGLISWYQRFVLGGVKVQTSPGSGGRRTRRTTGRRSP